MHPFVKDKRGISRHACARVQEEYENVVAEEDEGALFPITEVNLSPLRSTPRGYCCWPSSSVVPWCPHPCHKEVDNHSLTSQGPALPTPPFPDSFSPSSSSPSFLVVVVLLLLFHGRGCICDPCVPEGRESPKCPHHSECSAQGRPSGPPSKRGLHFRGLG